MLGGDTSLYELRPDGSSATHLADGTYRSPAWSPNATTFTFFRSGSLWAAGAPALPPEPSALDQAGAVVGSFMQARLSGQGDPTIYLDSSGKQAYSGGVLTLAVTGDARFSRYYILAQELTSTRPDTALFIVRLVLTKGKLDVSELEESLTLVRDSATRKFVIDQAAAGAKRDLGKGAGVVAVDVARDTVRLTFDSDLDLATVPGGVLVQDSKGNPVDATASYSNRVVTISGLDLKPGGQYRLVVLTTVRDVGSHNVASEYDLNFLGPAAPAAKDAGGQNGAGSVTASPSPTPSASPTPAS